jgi:hypothetical protein
MNIKPKIQIRKNSIDRWTPSIDTKDLKQDDNHFPSSPLEDRSTKRVVLPSIRNKLIIAKSVSEPKTLKTLRMLTSRDPLNPQVSKAMRYIYPIKSPVPKRQTYLNYVSLSPFIHDDILSISPRYQSGQECIKSIFIKK